jgi:hypothetical protein
MRISPTVGCVVLVALSLASVAAIADTRNIAEEGDYTNRMLTGVRSVWFNFTEISDANCSFPPGLEEEAKPLLAEIEKLGLAVRSKREVDAGEIPDLSVLVSIQASASDPLINSKQCSAFIKFEAFHSMVGRPRYRDTPMPLRVLAYRSIWYDTFEKQALRERLHATALHGIARFASAYIAANSSHRPLTQDRKPDAISAQ